MMAILTLVSNEENILQRKIIKKITEEEKSTAMSIFDEYKRKGVIFSEFSDKNWEITNEIRTIQLDFTLNEVIIKKYLKVYTSKEFVNILKYYICFCLGRYALITIRQILINIKKVMEETNCFLVMPKKVELLESIGVSDFIDIFPYSNKELIVQCGEDNHNRHRRRTLAEYQSYFLFDKIIDKFWERSSDWEKDLYYPIYLWWKISMIIPLRVTEFTVLPKDCIYEEKRILKVRRTRLKGEAGKSHFYKLDDDYRIYEYGVSSEIISMILDYQKRAKNYNEAKIDSMFSDDMFVSLLNTKGLERTNHLNSAHLGLLLDYFFIDIIGEKYGYKVLSKEEVLSVDISGELRHINDNEIVKITLGDSRHIAIQNMILNGCNILMSKEITGHESADLIFHYAGNMKNLIKCRAYSLFQMSKQKEVAIPMVTKTNPSVFLPQQETSPIEVDGGLCYSPLFTLYQDTKDCFTVAGDCEVCKYFKSKKGNMVIRKNQERVVVEKIERLILWLNSTRMNKDKDEFKVIMNQLRSNVENLQNGYIQDLNEEEKL